MCLGVVGLQCQGRLVGRHRFLQPALAPQRIAQVVVRLGVVGPQRDGFPDQFDRPGGVTLLELDDAEKVQGHDVVRLSRQNLCVQPLGFGQSARLVARHRFPELAFRRGGPANPGDVRSPGSRGGAPLSSVHSRSPRRMGWREVAIEPGFPRQPPGYRQG